MCEVLNLAFQLHTLIGPHNHNPGFIDEASEVESVAQGL